MFQCLRSFLNDEDKFFLAFRREAGKPVGRGPCADLFKSEECPFYPDYPSMGKAYPACCDRKGCSCECIYTCSTRQDMFTKLANSLNDTYFNKCTTSISSINEGNEWKLEQCKKSKGSIDHRDKIKECRQRKRKVTCAKSGLCIRHKYGKDECRFCYR